MYFLWLVRFSIAIFARVPEFDNKPTCAQTVRSFDKMVWGGVTLQQSKVNNHGTSAGCARCAHNDFFYYYFFLQAFTGNLFCKPVKTLLFHFNAICLKCIRILDVFFSIFCCPPKNVDDIQSPHCSMLNHDSCSSDGLTTNNYTFYYTNEKNIPHNACGYRSLTFTTRHGLCGSGLKPPLGRGLRPAVCSVPEFSLYSHQPKKVSSRDFFFK